MRLIVFSLLALGFWGIWALAGKLALQRGMPPRSIFLLEAVLGFVIGGIVLLCAPFFSMPTPWNSPWNYYGLLSGGALALGLLSYYFALEVGSLSVIVTATSLYPVVAILLAVILLGERPSRLQWLAIALALASLLLLICEEQRLQTERSGQARMCKSAARKRGS